MPDSKPYSRFIDGVCSACIDHEKKNAAKEGIDWKKQEKKFVKLVNEAKQKNAPYFDVLVPVSGGKDSIFQVHTALKYGLKTLAVNVDYGIKTEVGRKNLSIIPKMGASLITYTPEYKVHKKLIIIGFEDYGDPDLMSHGLLYAFPLWTAIQFDIPLVLEGENPAFEYGGDEESALKYQIDKVWFLKHVMTKEMTVEQISKKYNIPLAGLKLYDFPEKELKQKGIKAVFLSCFLKWDSEKHLQIAKKYGFQTMDTHREGTFRDYVGIDEEINRVHQYMKVLKFGYGRATDHACEEIRNGRMTRAEAIELVRKYDTQELSDHFVNDFCKFLGYTKEQFYEIIEKSRNKDIWKKDKKGKWYIEGWIGEK